MKRILLLLLIFVFPFSLALPTLASDIEMPQAYDELIGSLDDGITEYLPDGMLSKDEGAVEDATLEMTKAEYWVKTVRQIVGAEWRNAVLLLLELCGLLIVSAIFNALGRSLSSDAMSGAVRFCVTTAIFASVIRLT